MIRLCIALPFLALGLFAFLSAVVGFYRFPYVMSRMHAAAVGDTLGIGSLVIAVAILTGSAAATLKLVVILGFLFLTGPALTHLIAGAEVSSHPGAGKDYREEDRR